MTIENYSPNIVALSRAIVLSGLLCDLRRQRARVPRLWL